MRPTDTALYTNPAGHGHRLDSAARRWRTAKPNARQATMAEQAGVIEDVPTAGPLDPAALRAPSGPFYSSRAAASSTAARCPSL